MRGAVHERNGLPNQDAIHWLPESGHGSTVVLAVADGHGSARYPRSHTGARLAVEKAVQLVHDFLNNQGDGDNLSLIKDTTQEWLPRALVREWLEAVTNHLDQEPLSESELGLSDGSIAYGATLLVTAVTEKFAFYLQLGDGEILVVSEGGDVSRPMSKDERLFGNETTSLCAPDAWRDFRVSFHPFSQLPPALVLLSTDGYPNSFRHESGFLQVGSDLLKMIHDDGLASVRDNLSRWLSDSTQAGSGDDVTLGILCSIGE